MVKAAILLCASTASAAPITGMFGVGEQVSGGGGYPGARHALALDASIAWVVDRGIAIGVRGSIATASSYTGEPDYSLGYPETTFYSAVPVDLDITAIFTHERWWLAPWFGEHLSLSTTTFGDSSATADFAMIGATGGPPSMQTQSGYDANPVFQSWIAMTIGIAYHY